MEELLQKFNEIVQIVQRLRKECPWDREQTFESLRNYTVEEAYELSYAVITNNNEDIKKELGDLLLHVLMYSEIAKEQNLFELKDVIETLSAKLIYRHPHVFGEENAANAKEVIEKWEKLKLKEKNGNKSLLSGIPKALPAIIKAYRIQEKASGIGFDWQEKQQVWDKVAEEVGELKNVVMSDDKQKIFEEFGDVVFSLINAARLYDVHLEDALENTNQKFIKRFEAMEKMAISMNKNIYDLNIDQMEELWIKAKTEQNKLE